MQEDLQFPKELTFAKKVKNRKSCKSFFPVDSLYCPVDSLYCVEKDKTRKERTVDLASCGCRKSAFFLISRIRITNKGKMSSLIRLERDYKSIAFCDKPNHISLGRQFRKSQERK